MTLAAVLTAARLLDSKGAGLLERALDPLAHSVWPDVAWSFSGLTMGGGPVELGFSTHDRIMRATLEVAGPECPNPERLDAAVRLLRRLELPEPTPARLSEWRTLQARQTLHFGCWIGLRMTDSGARGKLYVELPKSFVSPLPGAAAQMLGHDPANGITEFYGRIAHPTAGLMNHVLGSDAGAMLQMVADLVARPVSGLLNWLPMGLSAATGPDNIPRHALFLRARAVAGGAAQLRPRFAHHPGYRILLGGVPDHALPDHGILTLVADGGGGVELRAAISPTALPK